VSKKLYGCELKLLQSGTAVVKGPKEDVSKCLKFIQHAIEHLTYKVLLSRNDDSFSGDSLRKITEQL